MQRRQYQVAGQCRLHRNLRGFPIAHFTDHDDVWILPQNRAQSTGKGQLDLGLNLNLIDATHLVFDRIFNGNDFQGRGVQRRE